MKYVRHKRETFFEGRYFTGRTGVMHLLALLVGRTYWAVITNTQDIILLPDNNESLEKELRENAEVDSWVRVRAFCQRDARAHAQAAFDQYDRLNNG